MIQARELRLGNWVKRDSGATSPDIVCQVNFDTFDVMPWDGIDGEIESLNPILLTPDILIAAGFEKMEDGDGGYYGELLSSNGFLFIEGDKNGYCDVFIDMWEHLRVRYVHQLQNLYFCLTGTELTIKL